VVAGGLEVLLKNVVEGPTSPRPSTWAVPPLPVISISPLVSRLRSAALPWKLLRETASEELPGIYNAAPA
jgi:hypothetical protein